MEHASCFKSPLQNLAGRCIFCIRHAEFFLLSILLQSLSTGMVPLTTVVTFTDMTEWPEPPRGLPKVHWKLPFDFFFPFKMVLSIERSYRDDLTAYFVVILILSSILCF